MSAILVFNTSFQNRGDALMVRALQERFGPAHDWSVAANIAFKSPADTRHMRICLSSDLPGETLKQRGFNRAVALAAAALRRLPKAWRRKTRFALLEDIDVAFDLSGYFFGDFWGLPKVERATRTYRKMRESGAKVILLPRTWGPFNAIGAEPLELMLESTDLAFARDLTSLRAIGDKLSEAQQAKLHFAPDYTHAVQPGTTARLDLSGQRVAWIIPNHCVLTSNTLSRAEYARLLGIAREELTGAGLHPKLLLHEVANDLGFIEDAPQMGFASEDLFISEDAVDAKTLISGASVVVTSSLHATYNALNSLVPVTVIPWNFKYGEALNHYHCAECLVDMGDPEMSLRRNIAMITDPRRVAELKDAMGKGKAEQVVRTDAMWERVMAVTGLRGGDDRQRIAVDA